MLEISVAEIMKMSRRLGVRLRVFDSEAQSSGPAGLSPCRLRSTHANMMSCQIFPVPIE